MQIRLLERPIKEKQIFNRILKKMRSSQKFFLIMESIMTVGTPDNFPVVMDILCFIGQNAFHSKLIHDKITQINMEGDTLIINENPWQTLLYLRHGKDINLYNRFEQMQIVCSYLLSVILKGRIHNLYLLA